MIAIYCGDASDEEIETLEKLLRSHPELSPFARDVIDMQAMLMSMGKSEQNYRTQSAHAPTDSSR